LEIDMNTMDPAMLITLGVIVILAIAAFALHQRNKSRHLEEHYGTEYRRAVDQMGSRSKAEQELVQRQKRVAALQLKPLSPKAAAHFAQAWKALQARFVDDPKQVTFEADQLVRELMLERGYPMGDFERLAADISVDHPAVVDHYRAAHAIALRDSRGQASTEDLRKALVHYRALFQDLLEVAPEPVSIRHAEAR
jgi:hypothetical protein